MKHRILAPREWTPLHPPFRVPEWSTLGKPLIPAQEMSRHVLATGQTGVGKTISAIKPLLRAAFTYPHPHDYARYAEQAREAALEPEPLEDLRPSALVIDPKAELGDQIAALQYAHPGLRDVVQLGTSEQPQVVWYFETADVKEMQSLEVADHILAQSIYLEREKRARDPYWGRRAESLIRLTLEIDHYLYLKGGLDTIQRFWNEVSSAVSAKVAAQGLPFNDPRGTRFSKYTIDSTSAWKPCELSFVCCNRSFPRMTSASRWSNFTNKSINFTTRRMTLPAGERSIS